MRVHGTVKIWADALDVWIESLRHHLFHSRRDTLLEHGRGELFLRCVRCGLRSPGVRVEGQPGPVLAPAVSVASPVARVPLLELVPSLGPEWRLDDDDACPAPGSQYLHH